MQQDSAAIVRAMSHPDRPRILTLCRNGRKSPKEIAEALGHEKPYDLARLSYHVRALHGAGLLKAAGTVHRRGAVQHFYVTDPEAVEQAAQLLESVARDLRGQTQLEVAA